MNIVLFDPAEIETPLASSDPRSQHIRSVLRRQVGDQFDVGLVNGPRGKAQIRHDNATFLELDFSWSTPHPPPPTTSLIIGLPRPQTARDILRDATTLGATSLHFVSTSRTDPNYAASKLWTSGEWRRQIISGAAQAFATHVPEVSWTRSLVQSLDSLCPSSPTLVALDVYASTSPLSNLTLPTSSSSVTLFIGPERGWDDSERALMAARQIPSFSLGDRVLRTETASTVALALINAARARA